MDEVLLNKKVNPMRDAYARGTFVAEYVKILRIKDNPRYVACVKIGPTGYCCPTTPDLNYQPNIKAGIENRLLCASPKIDPGLLSEFIEDCELWIKDNVKPLENVLSFRDWLAQSHYNNYRKEQLSRARENAPTLKHLMSMYKQLIVLKIFGKAEFKYNFGWSRNIAPRIDEFKAFYGPLIKSVEDELYTMPWVAKGMDAHQLPEKLENLVTYVDGIVYGSDFSHLEGSYDLWVFKLENKLLKAYLPAFAAEIDFLTEVCLSPQVLKSKEVEAVVLFARMSGEMTTALTHTWLNFMINKFNAKKQGAHINIAVTGDDAVYCSDKVITTEIISKLGFDYKLESFQSISRASFCHIVYNPRTLHLFTNVAEVLVKLGWSDSKYRNSNSINMLKGLYKAKLLSYISLYDHCPILTPYLYAQLQKYVKIKTVRDEDHYQNFPWCIKTDIEEPRIDPDDEAEFESIFGVSIAYQRELTSALCHMENQSFYPDIVQNFILDEVGPEVFTYFTLYSV